MPVPVYPVRVRSLARIVHSARAGYLDGREPAANLETGAQEKSPFWHIKAPSTRPNASFLSLSLSHRSPREIRSPGSISFC